MRRFPPALGILAAPAACAPSGVPPEIHGLDDDVVTDGTTNLTPCCLASGQSSSDDESLEFTAPADGTCYVVVDGYAGAENLYDISISASFDL